MRARCGAVRLQLLAASQKDASCAGFARKLLSLPLASAAADADRAGRKLMLLLHPDKLRATPRALRSRAAHAFASTRGVPHL